MVSKLHIFDNICKYNANAITLQLDETNRIDLSFEEIKDKVVRLLH
jgi:hypothetical protein